MQTSFSLVVVVALLAAVLALPVDPAPHLPSDISQQQALFRMLSKGANADFDVFSANVARVRNLQLQDLSVKYAIDETFLMSTTEFSKTRLNGGQSITKGEIAETCLRNNATAPTPRVALRDLPTSFDWREKGAVGKVKDQGMCGSCWSFSSTGNLEGQHFLKTGEMLDLSEQDIVDCSHDCSYEGTEVVCNQGCGGGWMWAAFLSLKLQGGIAVQSDYPYTAREGSCRFTKAESALTVSGYTCVNDDEDVIAATLVETGPLAVALNASPLMGYRSGVINTKTCDGSNLTHAVLLVGYGEENGVKYWIVKNSWGSSWGESGYFRLVRGINACGIGNGVVTAVL